MTSTVKTTLFLLLLFLLFGGGGRSTFWEHSVGLGQSFFGGKCFSFFSYPDESGCLFAFVNFHQIGVSPVHLTTGEKEKRVERKCVVFFLFYSRLCVFVTGAQMRNKQIWLPVLLTDGPTLSLRRYRWLNSPFRRCSMSSGVYGRYASRISMGRYTHNNDDDDDANRFIDSFD